MVARRVAKPRQQRIGQRLAGEKHEFDRRKGPHSFVGIKPRAHQRRHAMHHTNRLIGEPAQHPARIEQHLARGDMQSRSAGQRKQHVAQHHIERQRGDLRGAVARPDRKLRPLPVEKMGEALVGAQHRLGRAGAAAGKEHIGGRAVTRHEGGRRRLGHRGKHRMCRPFGKIQPVNRIDAGADVRGETRGERLCQQISARRRQRAIDRRHDPARRQRGQHRGDHAETHEPGDRHDITGLQARRLQTRSAMPHHARQFGIAIGPFSGDQRQRLGVALRPAQQSVGDRFEPIPPDRPRQVGQDGARRVGHQFKRIGGQIGPVGQCADHAGDLLQDIAGRRPGDRARVDMQAQPAARVLVHQRQLARMGQTGRTTRTNRQIERMLVRLRAFVQRLAQGGQSRVRRQIGTDIAAPPRGRVPPRPRACQPQHPPAYEQRRKGDAVVINRLVQAQRHGQPLRCPTRQRAIDRQRRRAVGRQRICDFAGPDHSGIFSQEYCHFRSMSSSRLWFVMRLGKIPAPDRCLAPSRMV